MTAGWDRTGIQEIKKNKIEIGAIEQKCHGFYCAGIRSLVIFGNFFLKILRVKSLSDTVNDTGVCYTFLIGKTTSTG